MARTFKTVAVAAARAASEKKAEDIALLHVSRASPVTDYLLIATALSRPHLEALESEVEKAAEQFGFACLHRSKPKSDLWRVSDFGGLIVHLMLADVRAFYALDKLYHGSPRVKWEPAVSVKARPSRGRAGAAAAP